VPLRDLANTEVVYGVMQSVIDGIVAVYNAEDVDLPTRHILGVQATAHDCEQLSIVFEQLYVGGPGDQAEQPMRCESPRSVVMTVQLVRCVPTMQARGVPPTPAAMAESTSKQLTDTWLLLEGVMSSEAANYLGALADVTVTPPDGGYQAVQANVVVGIP
jgi:hypothetical protein